MVKVSVVLPVYNSALYIEESLVSMLHQTYPDFEIIVIDDGSTDGTLQKIQAFADPRIRLIAHQENRGLVGTLNEGLSLARGEYIARMDGDDIALPERLERQVAYLDAHPEVGVLGTQAHLLGIDKVTTKPLVHEEIRVWQLFHCTFVHPTVMLRRSVIENHGIRYLPYPHAEDYEIWNRLAELTRLANLPDVLLRYRLHPNQVSNLYEGLQERTAETIRRMQFRQLGLEPSFEEYQTHMDFALFRIKVKYPDHYAKAEAWAHKLLNANWQVKRYDQETLNSVLSHCFKYSELWHWH